MMKRILGLAVSVAMVGINASASAGGFAIGTQSGSGTGNAFAGGAAAAEDPSTVWYNPAGMSLLPKGRSVAGSLHVLKPSFKFSDGGSTGAFAVPGAGNGGDGGGWAFVPQGFFVFNPEGNLSFGVAFNVPFGLKTEYDPGWRGQLTALKSEIKTFNLNPAIAYKASSSFSIGAGISVQRAEAELTGFDGAGTAVTKLKDTSWGWNLGVLFHPTSSARIGVHYRSAIDYDLTGNASFANPGFAARIGPIAADLKAPDNISLSAFVSVSPTWDIMGDITYTKWGTVQRLAPVNTTNNVALTPLVLNWDDTWRYSIGANYKPNQTMKWRFGIAVDETPTNDVDRTARLPDQRRIWAAIGLQYRLSRASVIDVGYAHEFIRDAAIRNTAPPAPGTLVGSFENKADILSIQFTHSF